MRNQTETKSLQLDVEEIRKRARQAMELGPVTGDYPLDVNQACRILNEALASEVVCVLRYRQHQIAAKGIDFPQVAAEFREHAEKEEQHMLMLAERINQLGGEPELSPALIAQRSFTQYETSEDLIAMIQQDLVAERIVIEIYREMIPWFGEGDPTTRRLLEDILEDEEEHANDLADLLVSTQKRHNLLHNRGSAH